MARLRPPAALSGEKAGAMPPVSTPSSASAGPGAAMARAAPRGAADAPVAAAAGEVARRVAVVVETQGGEQAGEVGQADDRTARAGRGEGEGQGRGFGRFGQPSTSNPVAGS